MSTAIRGSYAYLAAYQEGVRVIDISNPPARLRSFLQERERGSL